MKLVFSAISIMWMFVVFIVSMVDLSTNQSSIFPNSDKVVHFLVYGIMTIFFLSRLQLEKNISEVLAITIAIVAATIFGGLMEILQGLYTAGRTASMGDFIANALGAVVASVAYRKWLWEAIQANYAFSIHHQNRG